MHNSMKGISHLSLATFASLKEFAESHTFEERASNDVQFINDKGDIYLPYSRKYGPLESGQDRLPMFNPNGDEDARMGNLIEFQSFSDKYIDNQVTTISFNATISLATLLRQLSGDPDIYGVVLQKSGERNQFALNPLHPMVAFMIVSGLYKLPVEGKLHVFSYNALGKTSSKTDSANDKRKIEAYIKDYESFFALSGDIVRNPVTVKQTAVISDTTLENISDSPLIENIMDVDIVINRTSSEHNDISTIKALIIPNQLIVDSTLSPYYGICNITKPTTGDMRGCSLSPMGTGNINRSASSGDRYRSSLNSGTSNVCTGSENAGSTRGWFTLSRVNLGSMHYQRVLDEDEVFPFIQASKDISHGIWKVVEEKDAARIAASDASPEASPEAEPEVALAQG